MSCIDLLLTRRSIRKFKDASIPDDVMQKILEAGRQSPSAVNIQPWHFIIVDDQELKNKLGGGILNRMIRKSSFTLVGCYRTRNPLTRSWALVDTTIAMQSMVLAAHLQGIGSCWLADYNESKVKEQLNLPRDIKIVALIAFGIPDETPGPKKKKKMESIVHYNRW
jgi:nitroreductase